MSEPEIGIVISKECQFEWKIPNFSTIKADVGKAVKSPTFCLPFYPDEFSTKAINLHWRILLYPSGGYMGRSHTNYISVCLENLDAFEVSTVFSIILVNELSSKNYIPRCVDKVDVFGKKKIWGVSEYLPKNAIMSFLVNDTLTMSCRIFSTNVTSGNGDLDEEDDSETSLNHFAMLFNTGKFSDLTISIGKQKLHVHKNIVASLSPVFLAMFENQMKEQNENAVEIVDIEFDIIKEMLRYIYVRKVNEIEKIASDLFVAADKYCIKGLRGLCENSLCQDLTMDNALERLEMAIRYNAKKLKQSAMKFIADNLKIFNSKQEFRELSLEYRSELLSYIAEYFELRSVND